MMGRKLERNYNGGSLDRVGQIGKIANDLASDLLKALAERDHWKANHDAQVERARVLVERTDMPLERVQAYKLLVAANADHNINDQCTVTLTEAGAKIYNEWGNQHKYPGSTPYRHADGSWVGWTYWFGGGKHGEPQAIDWRRDAYEVTCVEEEKMVVVRTFAKVPDDAT